MADPRRIALHLNNLAMVLQQLAAELAASEPAIEDRMAKYGMHVDGVPGRRLSEPASVAEPDCGCSLYMRCDAHSTDQRCKCNGPAYRSSACRIAYHAQQARSMPDRDPALLD